jgi:hypothetical protein
MRTGHAVGTRMRSTSARGRARFAQPCPDLEAQLIADDLLELDAQLRQQIEVHAQEPPASPSPAGRGGLPYRACLGGLVWDKPTPQGPVPVFLTNFTAKILADIVEDDGVEQRRSFAMEAVLSDRVWRFTVPAAQFPSLQWATEHLGATAIVSAGLGTRDHARAAIQALSGDIQECHVFTHTGWRELPQGWAYLHAGGAIDGHGPLADVEVTLPEALAYYAFPDPPTGAALVRAIQASLRVLRLAPTRVTVPLYAAVWRAALGGADFALHLAGRSGVGKTEVAALAQQHFGAPMDARHLPGSWSSTGNALQGLAFLAKDALLVIDDFAPTGSSADVQRLHREADRLLRAQGNRAGRQRMRADTTLWAPKPPRGLIVSTGEDVPRGQSLRARVLIVELGTDELKWAQLSRCQQEAAAGLYTQALAGFVRWLAPRYARLQCALKPALARLRQQATGEEGHPRTPEIIAHLALGLRLFLIYGGAAGALTRQEAQALWQEGRRALQDAARDQAPHQHASEPAARFLELLSAAIASGQAHVAADDGLPPPAPEAWGWRRMTVGAGVYERDEWQPPAADRRKAERRSLE